MTRVDAVNQLLNCDVMVFSVLIFISYLQAATLLCLRTMVTSVYKELKNLSQKRQKSLTFKKKSSHIVYKKQIAMQTTLQKIYSNKSLWTQRWLQTASSSLLIVVLWLANRSFWQFFLLNLGKYSITLQRFADFCVMFVHQSTCLNNTLLKSFISTGDPIISSICRLLYLVYISA